MRSERRRWRRLVWLHKYRGTGYTNAVGVAPRVVATENAEQNRATKHPIGRSLLYRPHWRMLGDGGRYPTEIKQTAHGQATC